MNYRRRGITLELEIKKELAELFPEIDTTRNASRKLDSLGIDYVNTGDFWIQVKSGNYDYRRKDVLDRIKKAIEQGKIEEKVPVLIMVYRSGKGRKKTKFNKIVVMYNKDFDRVIEDPVVEKKNFRRDNLKMYEAIRVKDLTYTTLERFKESLYE